MTRNIVDIIQEQHVNQPTPTEKAQVLVTFASNAQVMFRFNTVKKAEKEYKALLAAWKNNDKFHLVHGDMFDGVVDLYSVLYICFVDHSVVAKFVPIP